MKKIPLASIVYADDSPFDARFDFEYDGQAYEKLDDTFPAPYRIMLNEHDDYDYVEDADLIRELDKASAHIKI